MSLTAVALVALVAGPSGFPPLPPPEAYARPADQALARQGKLPCVTFHAEAGVTTAYSLPTDQCYKMLSPQRMRGVWIDAFEGSQFFPGRTTPPPAGTGGPMIWLDVERVRLPPSATQRRLTGRAVLLEFVGRRTRYRVPSGHMGLFDYTIIVDRIISAEELPSR